MESSEENTNINEKQISLPEINVPNTFINNIEDNVEDYGQNISQQSIKFNIEEAVDVKYMNSESLDTLKDLKSSSSHNLVVKKTSERIFLIKNNYKLKIPNKNCSRLERIRTVHFKNQRSKNVYKKLELYRCNNKRNSSSFGKMKRSLRSDSVLNTVHPTKRIKRQIAKENIFGPKLTQIDNNKANKESFEARMGILTPKHSFTSQNYNFQSNKPMELEKKEEYKDNCNNNCLINSQQHIVNNNLNEKRNVFTTGVVNIVVAQVNNTSILDYNQKETLENLMLQGSLTSAESFISQLDTITSTSNSEMSNTNSKKDYFTIISSNESSSTTLTPPQTNFELISENDNFVMAKTSSYFKKNNSDSIRTLTSEGIKDKLKSTNNDFRTLDSQNTKPFLLDTIINMKIYPNIPENKCQNLYLDNCDNVIITNDKIKTMPASTFENDYISATRQIILKNIDKKSYKDDSGNRNHIYLPDENTIKDMLTETDNSQKRSCSEESRNYIPIADLWEKLSTLLDNAIRKLEESMMEKIKNEIKQVLSAFESNMNLKLAEPNSLDEGLQCCLVNNQIIDELTFNLNTECDNVNKIYKNSLETLHKKIEHVLDIIKPPVSTRISKDTEEGRSVAVSLSDGLKIIHSTKNNYIAHVISSPIRFLKENFLVVISAPIFCFALFMIYCFLALGTKF
ncbi:asparagine-rich protein-like [Vanessa atalanta]|uniref:asparagine-rich protein-like n=1 Tax=Vanessa atalanta TaxID=42275 RepID=UPI001FCCF300|nr:asparagine-rich protein-like [Vanessa atalanta]